PCGAALPPPAPRAAPPRPPASPARRPRPDSAAGTPGRGGTPRPPRRSESAAGETRGSAASPEARERWAWSIPHRDRSWCQGAELIYVSAVMRIGRTTITGSGLLALLFCLLSMPASAGAQDEAGAVPEPAVVLTPEADAVHGTCANPREAWL